MTVDFIPRRMIDDKLAEGWRLVPGHSYNVSDYAILMVLPDVPEPLTAAAIRTTAARFRVVDVKGVLTREFRRVQRMMKSFKGIDVEVVK